MNEELKLDELEFEIGVLRKLGFTTATMNEIIAFSTYMKSKLEHKIEIYIS